MQIGRVTPREMIIRSFALANSLNFRLALSRENTDALAQIKRRRRELVLRGQIVLARELGH
jgi:hypothetical protein